MTYHNVTNTRLEIEVPTAGLPNLVQNPSGELGAWGWVTPVANTTLTSDGAKLTYNNITSQASYFTTEWMPVAATKYVSGRLDLKSISTSHNIKVRFEWGNSSKAVLSSSTQSGPLTTIGTVYSGTYQAPANTAYVRLRVDFYNGTGNASANTNVSFNKAMVTWQNTGTATTVRTNLVTNPSFETNTTGWTAGPNTTISTAAQYPVKGTNTLRLVSPASSGSTSAVTAFMAVTPGADYVAYMVLKDLGGGTSGLFTRDLMVTWYTSANAFISQTQVSSNEGYVSGIFTAPSNAAKATVTCRGNNWGTMWLDTVLFEKASSFLGYFDGSSSDTAAWDYAWSGTAHGSTSTATSMPGTFEYAEPTTWQNIMGPTHEIKVSRKELDTGLLSAEILDAVLDPAVSNTIRPGKRIRLVTEVAGIWQPVFTGKVTDASTSYPRNSVGKVETRVSLTASDNVSSLSNQGESRGIQNVADLPFILEGKGVPWSVNGSGNQVASASVVSYNENASVIDQVEITRATNHGYAWVNRQGVLCVYDNASMPTATEFNFDDTGTYLGYTDIDVDFDLDNCINSVMVKWLRYDAGTGNTTEIPRGPFVDQTSIGTWGARSREFTIHGPASNDTDAFAQSYANAVLAANATPVVKANSLTMPVRNAVECAAAAVIDLYTKVSVVYGTKVNASYRVTGIEHTITPEAWNVSYSFGSTGSVAQPTWVPSPPFTGIVAGSKASVLQSATQNMVVNATTLVTWDTINLNGQQVTAASGGVTINQAGMYRITGQMGLNTVTASAGLIHLVVAVNGAGIRVLNRGGIAPIAPTVMGGSTVIQLNAGDVVTLGVFHTNGANRPLFGGTTYATEMQVEPFN